MTIVSDEESLNTILQHVGPSSREKRYRVFQGTLNEIMADYQGTQQQQIIARLLNITPAALSHYLAGRRTPPIEFIPRFANILGLAPEIENLLITAWNFDQGMEALGAYAQTIQDLKAYDRVGFISLWLQYLHQSLTEARQQVRSRFSTLGD